MKTLALITAILTASASPLASAEELSDGSRLDARHGKVVYKRYCATCHDRGRKGAPKLIDPKTWASRSLPSFSAMDKHATAGFLGMPAKGGRSILSDADIADAVFFMKMKLDQPR